MDHLKRCKTSNFHCHFTCQLGFSSNLCFWLFVTIILNFQQGGNLVCIAGCPTKRAMPRLIWSLINSTYLLQFWIWDVANPRTTKPFSTNWFPVLHGFRNLNFELHQNSQNFRQGRRKITSLRFSPPIFQTCLSVFTELFVHVRCIPHQ